jgi:membrane-associated phospholipid phosphatase
VIAWLRDAERVDVAVYAAIAATPTPALDAAMVRLSRAADMSRLNIAAALLLGVAGGPPGRQAARSGLVAVAATSAIVNAVLKPLGRRRRPPRDVLDVPLARQVPMPTSSSLPSGHAASAFAFATAVGDTLPQAGTPLLGFAAVVGYSRVHTGVHYPGDVIAGAVIGSAIAQASTRGR